jgi:hypothetical protein
MVMIREVLRLQAEGRLPREIAARVNCSRSTVQECLHGQVRPAAAGRFLRISMNSSCRLDCIRQRPRRFRRYGRSRLLIGF